MTTWKTSTGHSVTGKADILNPSLREYKEDEYRKNKKFGSTCPGFKTPVLETKKVKAIGKGIVLESLHGTFGDKQYTQIVTQWADNARQANFSSQRKCGVLWISDTLCMDLNVPLETLQPKQITRQILFFGEGLPTFLLSLYSESQLKGEGENKENVETYTVYTARLLSRLLHRFSAYCDFVLLPCTLKKEEFTEKGLTDEVKDQQSFTRLYYLGPKELNQYMFCELVRAARALSCMSYIPDCLGDNEERILCLDEEWHRAVSDVIQKLVNKKSSAECITLERKGGDSFKTDVAVLEAARRLSFNRAVKIITTSSKIKKGINHIKKRDEEEFGINLKLEVEDSQQGSDKPSEEHAIWIQHSETKMSEKQPLVALPETAAGIKRKRSKAGSDPTKKRKTEEPSTSRESQESKKDPDFDEDQLQVIINWNKKCLFINGGPGSGKTYTVCKLVEKIQKESENSRILVLTYNRNSRSEIEKRLSKLGVQFLSKQKINEKDPGCLVSTFDSFGFALRSDHSKKKIKTKGFTERLEESATKLANSPPESLLRKWDWVIVDEAQDVNYTHAFIVETLHESSGHLVVAGDPRQQLYEGATWFAEKWKHEKSENKFNLHKNHRSTPEIVAFLNEYSKENFPDLHFDQTTTRKSGNPVTKWQKKITNYAEQAGQFLAKSDHGDAYAITPFTVDKFRNEITTKTIQQVVHEEKPESFVRVYRSVQSNDVLEKNDAYIIGTSKALKGTQCSRVVVYGLTAPYYPFIVSKQAVQRSFFVALSRAENHLHIMVDERIQPDNPLAFEPKLKKVGKRDSSGTSWGQNTISVENIAREYKWFRWQNEEECLANVPPLEIDDRGDEDFVKEYFKQIIKGEEDAYTYVADQYKKKIGRKWTVSSYLEKDTEKHKEMCKPFKTQLLERMKATAANLKWNKEVQKGVFPHRCEAEVGKLKGTLDCRTAESGLNLLYTKETEYKQLQTAAMLATLFSLPGVYLMNLRCGEIEKVNGVPKKELMNLARVNVAHRTKYSHTRREIELPKDFVKACCIAVGEVINPQHNLLVEIGAVAFSMDGTIRGTYHDVLKGVEDVSSGASEKSVDSSTDQSTSDDSDDSTDGKVQDVSEQKRQRIETEQKTKLRIVSKRDLKADQRGGQRNFRKWVNAVSGRRCFLHSGDFVASQPKLSKLGPTFDVFTILKDMPFARGSDEESEPTLKKFVIKAFGHDFIYVPGRAFEDAVAMATLMLKTVEVK
ncbi:uncharacterized protein [Littorina saxatilis]|uniref:uncharacterized protein n=1 Tax=Littorina saxatilis TaxID=31220 RepID=UPI0038B68FFD